MPKGHDLNVTPLRPGAETYLLTALLESTYNAISLPFSGLMIVAEVMATNNTAVRHWRREQGAGHLRTPMTARSALVQVGW